MLDCEKLQSPAGFFLAGPTSCGKSHFLAKLISCKNDMFVTPPVRVYYAYKEWQPELFGQLQAREGVRFVQGLPSEDDIKQWSEEAGKGHIALILDDLQHEVCKSQQMAVAFGVLSHHCNVSLFLVSQNLFPQSRYSRDLVLNCHYLVIFQSKRDRLQVANLGKQLFPGRSRYFLSAYEDCVSMKNYNYLFVDLHPCTSKELMLRTSIFPDETTLVYLPK